MSDKIEIDPITGTQINPVKTPVGWVYVEYKDFHATLKGSSEAWQWKIVMPVSGREYMDGGFTSRDAAIRSCQMFVGGMKAGVLELKSVKDVRD